MPEFCLNDQTDMMMKLDTFTTGYVEAMMFTNADSGDERENRANELGTRRITKKSWASIVEDCKAFQAHAKPALDEAYERAYEEDQAGRDFWFTRQGHGVGYRDRDVLDENGLGRALTKLAKAHGEAMTDIYRGWIHHG